MPLLALCSLTHRESHLDLVTVAIAGAVIALVAVIPLGSAFGSFQGNSFQAKL